LIHIVIFAALVFGLANSEDLSGGCYRLIALLLAGFIFYTPWIPCVSRKPRTQASLWPRSAGSIGASPMGPEIFRVGEAEYESGKDDDVNQSLVVLARYRRRPSPGE